MKTKWKIETFIVLKTGNNMAGNKNFNKYSVSPMLVLDIIFVKLDQGYRLCSFAITLIQYQWYNIDTIILLCKQKKVCSFSQKRKIQNVVSYINNIIIQRKVTLLINDDISRSEKSIIIHVFFFLRKICVLLF